MIFGRCSIEEFSYVLLQIEALINHLCFFLGSRHLVTSGIDPCMAET